ncbi:lipase [Allomyces macrogynus ATCC 38327]|uniref:Lipase n=1 Tax=Allomyces macrogynus (strain ATCC 38327) TaxID=578462 RepID=A0A0L0SBZ9_ALLM3|nr:lipase [Allomyces macrogynus ATCC 38327]|eukprot:KNE60078.1 lipase [Allomyces macrogynus ATCC 38327]
MLDHVYGKPSTTWKRIEAILVTLASIKVLKAYHGRSPPGGTLVNRANRKLQAFAPWQIVLGTLTSGYLLSKLSLFAFMNAPEPYARYYNKNFYRATWIMTALDAGFWTAMNIKPKFLRDLMSIVFTMFYLVFADQAEAKVRRLRSTPTVSMMRVSWEKQKHPYIQKLARSMMPKITWRSKRIQIPRLASGLRVRPGRPKDYGHGRVPLLCRQGGESCRRVILKFTAAGSSAWTRNVMKITEQMAHMAPGCLVVALNYGKAPEYPFPYGLEENFEFYRLIRETNGECLGLGGWFYDVTVTTSHNGHATTTTERRRRDPIKITLSGDSAGGNMAAGVTLRAIESRIMVPTALVLIYPHLNFNMGSWLEPGETQMLRVESSKHVNQFVDLHQAVLSNGTPSPHASNGDLAPPATNGPQRKRSFLKLASSKLSALRTQKPHTVFDDYGGADHHPHELDAASSRYASPSVAATPQHQNPLVLTSHMANFNDRVLTPEMMRALALLYAGPSPVPFDLQSDYHLSPILTPEALLVKFPKVYLICGEKDPLVDDTIIFAGRLRDAKQRAWRRDSGKPRPRDQDVAEVTILEGVSHAVLQMSAFLPEALDAISLIHKWFMDTFRDTTNMPVDEDAASAPRIHAPAHARATFTIGADGPESGAASPTSVSRPARPTRSMTMPVPARTRDARDEDVAIMSDDDDQWLEFRDNAHVDQKYLLARRTMHLSHGLFGDEARGSERAFHSKIGTPNKKQAAPAKEGVPKVDVERMAP